MSLGDFWDNRVPDEWRTEALNTVRRCRNLDWLILTKRPQNTGRHPRQRAFGTGGILSRSGLHDDRLLGRTDIHRSRLGELLRRAADGGRNAAPDAVCGRLWRACRRRVAGDGTVLKARVRPRRVALRGPGARERYTADRSTTGWFGRPKSRLGPSSPAPMPCFR
jgi:hypothetical protein